jgi:hypothetical protein
LDRLDLIIREKQTELDGLNAELDEALTGLESPDYETAGRILPLIYDVETDIERLEKLRSFGDIPQGFEAHLSGWLRNDNFTILELWAELGDFWVEVTTRLLEIRKLKTGRRISCTLRLMEAVRRNLDVEWAGAYLQHIGWTARPNGATFYYKTSLKSPDQFDAFCQVMSVTMLEALSCIWRNRQQFYRFR